MNHDSQQAERERERERERRGWGGGGGVRCAAGCSGSGGKVRGCIAEVTIRSWGFMVLGEDE